MKKKEREEEEKVKAIKMYNTLLNSLSHELRTPISTIIGAIDTIRENKEKLASEQVNDLHSEINLAAFRLNRQVENLLNMSRLEAGFIRPKKDWCDVNELIFSILKGLQEETPSHYLSFKHQEELPLFNIDRGLTEQILHNLIHNAMQYTPVHTNITVSATAENNFLVIVVADQGNGFPTDEIDSVFDKFYRLNGAVSGGTGLGLSIVKGYTEAMDGQIILENLADKGAKFTLSIPAETSPKLPIENE